MHSRADSSDQIMTINIANVWLLPLDGIVLRTRILVQLAHKLCVSMWMEQKRSLRSDGVSLPYHLRCGFWKEREIAIYDGQFDVLCGMRNANA